MRGRGQEIIIAGVRVLLPMNDRDRKFLAERSRVSLNHGGRGASAPRKVTLRAGECVLFSVKLGWESSDYALHEFRYTAR